MALEYKFNGRDKLVKGYTYPIKRGELDAALEKAGVTDLDHMSYICHAGKTEKKLIISSDMLGEAFHPGAWHKQSPDIGVYAVSITVSQQVAKLVKEQNVLNRLAAWLKELEQAENVRRNQHQFFQVYFQNDQLEIEQT